MKKFVIALIGGLIVGALSWAVVPLVSNRFEPFDSTAGFYLGQFLMTSVTAYCGYKYQFRVLACLFIGIYSGQILYAYTFGGNERRAWFLLGLITTVALVVIPILVGIIAYIIQRVRKRNTVA